MDFLIISLVAFFASGLTLFSGFGLGTILLPAFALFFSIEVAVALTAVVHFLNNLFKLGLLGKFAVKKMVIRFGVPAIFAAFLGAYLLTWLADLKPLTEYSFAGKQFQVLPDKLIIALLMILFAIIELFPLERFSIPDKYLPVGGILSGFFGGLSGHQGALRSAFLLRTGMTKKAFIATGIVIAILVDISRLTIYSTRIFANVGAHNISLLIAATASAFLGAFIANKLLKKITLKTIQILVSVMLMAIAVGLGLGII